MPLLPVPLPIQLIHSSPSLLAPPTPTSTHLCRSNPSPTPPAPNHASCPLTSPHPTTPRSAAEATHPTPTPVLLCSRAVRDRPVGHWGVANSLHEPVANEPVAKAPRPCAGLVLHEPARLCEHAVCDGNESVLPACHVAVCKWRVQARGGERWQGGAGG
jgi:hypothetical protein